MGSAGPRIVGTRDEAAFQVYLKERASLSQSFNYWNTYVSDLFPIIIKSSIRTYILDAVIR